MNNQDFYKNGPPENFDNTIISQYCSCQRSAYWFLRGLTPATEPAYFSWGRAWGIVISNWHEGKSPEESLQAGLKEWEQSPFMDEDKVNNWDNLETLFKGYVKEYEGLDPWNQVGYELGFLFPIPGTSINYGGALDAYIEWPGYGILSREDKTTGNYITTSYLEQWKTASQVTGYYWGLWQLLNEKPFGILMNICSKRKRKEPSAMYHRQLEEREDHYVESFIKDTILIADSLRNQWSHWTWPKIGERVYMQCSGGIGKSPCPYLTLCLSGIDPENSDDSEYDFSQFYTWRDKWTPWERDSDKVV